MKKIAVFLAILVLTSSYTLQADEVQVASSVDRNRVEIDEEISLTVRIIGARGNLQAPRLPSFQGFDSFYTGRTSQFTFAGGKSSSTVEFAYVLVPKVMGRFVLQPIEVWIEGKSYKTLPVEIEVLGGAAGRPSAPPVTAPAPSVPTAPVSTFTAPPAAPPQLVKDENIFAKAWVDKTTVYPNEQILLTYTLYTRYDTRYEGFEEEPSVSGFWIEDFPLDRDLGRETVSLQGKRYIKADVRKIALFPTAPAQYTIQPGLLKVSVREEPRTSGVFDEFFGDSFFSGGGFFARRVDKLLKPEPITITVKPFPEKGKPEGFNGAVGQFRLSASVDKDQVKQNEPVTLKLVLEGEGNIETLTRPSVPELTGFKVYDGDSSSQLFKSGSTIGGKKTIEVIFIPTEAGELSIPPLEFSFFDPRRETYQTLRTQAFPLKVAPSAEPARLPAELEERAAFKKEIRRETQDIHYIHEEIPSDRLPRLQRYLYQGLLVANLLGLVLAGNGLLRRRRLALFARDTALMRRKLARSFAQKRLKMLRRLAQSQNPAETQRFVEEAEKTLSMYFCNKFNVSSYNFTREWLEEKLTQVYGSGDPLLKEIREFYELASEARFGRGTPPLQERREFIDLIETVIRRMEK